MKKIIISGKLLESAYNSAIMSSSKKRQEAGFSKEKGDLELLLPCNPLLQVKEISLYCQSSGKPGQASAAPNDPMAGNDNGQGIFIGCPTHGPGLIVITEQRCNLTIGPGLAKGDLLYNGPYGLLKGCSLRAKQEVKCFPLSLEILFKLGLGLAEQGMIIPCQASRRSLSLPGARKTDAEQGMVIGKKRKLAKGGKNGACRDHVVFLSLRAGRS